MIETIRAAFVISRRDFTAIIFSKSFFFFLLGPLFPLIIGVAFGGIGQQVRKDIDRTEFGIAMSQSENEKLTNAHLSLSKKIGKLPHLVALPNDNPDDPNIADRMDEVESSPLTLIISGTLEQPILTGSPSDLKRWQGRIGLLVQMAQNSPKDVSLKLNTVDSTSSSNKRGQLMTAQAGQAVLVLLTMILAGMVLSNLVEEKTNKIIEILAAAIPMDAIFLGKLFAMLGMALVGITVWTSLGLLGGSIIGLNVGNLPTPAVGWPLFSVLMVAYFSMAYLLLGSLFLGIGAMATTVREVQTLSMPVTMGQLLVFFLAFSAITKLGEPIEWFAVAFPFSSPFAMIARAAQMDNLWQHGLALIWQGMFTLIIIRFSVMLFRRNVMKSGNSARKKSLLARIRG